MSIEAWSALGTWAAVVLALGLTGLDALRRRAERHDDEMAQARLITANASNMGGLMITLENNSEAPIHGPELDDVMWVDNKVGAVSWKVSRRVIGASSVQTRLLPGKRMEVPVILLNADDKPVSAGVGEYRITFSFIDAKGLEWSRVGGNQPVRVIAKRRLLRRDRKSSD